MIPHQILWGRSEERQQEFVHLALASRRDLLVAVLKSRERRFGFPLLAIRQCYRDAVDLHKKDDPGSRYVPLHWRHQLKKKGMQLVIVDLYSRFIVALVESSG